MKIMVTGGAGFIGYHTCRAILKTPHKLKIVDDFSTGKFTNIDDLTQEFPEKVYDIEVVNVSINESERIISQMEGVDAIIHLAAKVSVPLSVKSPYITTRTNVGGFLSVLDAARVVGVKRFVYASSAAVYGDSPPPHREDTMNLYPKSPYGLDKLANEMYAELFYELYGIETIGLRYFNVYGPRQDPNSSYAGVVTKFLKCAKDGKPFTINGNGEQIRTFVNVEDVAKANLLATFSKSMPCKFGGVINVASPVSTVTVNHLVRQLNNLVPVPVSIQYGNEQTGDVARSIPDLTNLEMVLRETIDLPAGLTELVRYFFT